MKESVAIAKEADTKKDFSPTKSDKSVHRVRNEHEGQLGSLRGVIGNIRRNGGMPSVESIATELSGVSIAQRAPALLALQQTHGNRYVQRVVAGIQAKLVVGHPVDIYEQEADRVADAVMRMPEPGVQRQAEEEEISQTKEPSNQTTEVTSHLEAGINAVTASGQPFPESARAFFELRFMYDFSQVRVHTNAEAGDLAEAVNARAFTVGRDIFFGTGQYAPESAGGKHLIAHELAHVVQQEGSASAKLQRKPEDAKDANLFIEDPEKVVEFEKEFAGSSDILTIARRRTEVKSGTKFGESTFIARAGGKVYYEWKNTIRACSVAEFERGLELEVIAKQVLKRTAWITPVAKYEALAVMVVLRLDLALDVFGNLIAGKSIIDEEAMRGYCASVLFAPLGKIKVGGKLLGKAIDILIDIAKAAGESAFQELMKGGKLKTGKFSEDVLKATITSQLGKHIAKLPADSERVLKEVNDKIREVAGGAIAKEVGAVYEAGKQAVK